MRVSPPFFRVRACWVAFQRSFLNRIKCLEFVFLNRRLEIMMFTNPPVKFAMQTKCIRKFVLEKKIVLSRAVCAFDNN